MAILHMRKQAHGHHKKKGETCRFSDTIHVIFLNTLACYTRRLIQLEKCHNLSLAESFLCAIMQQVHNIPTIITHF